MHQLLIFLNLYHQEDVPEGRNYCMKRGQKKLEEQ